MHMKKLKKLIITVFFTMFAFRKAQKAYNYCAFCKCRVWKNEKSLQLLCFLQCLHSEKLKKLMITVLFAIAAYGKTKNTL